MSDDRFQPDDANANDPRAPYVDRKPYRRDSGTKRSTKVTAEEIEAGIVEYCRRMGIPRHEFKKGKNP